MKIIGQHLLFMMLSDLLAFVSKAAAHLKEGSVNYWEILVILYYYVKLGWLSFVTIFIFKYKILSFPQIYNLKTGVLLRSHPSGRRNTKWIDCHFYGKWSKCGYSFRVVCLPSPQLPEGCRTLGRVTLTS